MYNLELCSWDHEPKCCPRHVQKPTPNVFHHAHSEKPNNRYQGKELFYLESLFEIETMPKLFYQISKQKDLHSHNLH